jgi:hypothetical protein
VTEGWFTPHPNHVVDGKTIWSSRGSEAALARSFTRQRLEGMAHVAPGTSPRYFRFRTESFLAPALPPPGGGAQEPTLLFRGMPSEPALPSPDQIRAGALAGGDWLASDVDADGRFHYYTYLPNRDHADDSVESYNVIRHIAAAWMLQKLGQRWNRPEWIAAADRAMAWVDPSIVSEGHRTGGIEQFTVVAGKNGESELGQIATATLALAERRETLDAAGLAKLRGLGATLEYLLRPDGGFWQSTEEATARMDRPQDTLLYEPGEAFLALTTLAEAFPDEPHWRFSALRSAGYQSSCFNDAWKGKDCNGDEHDAGILSRAASVQRIPAVARLRFVDRVAWQTLALEKLARLTGDRSYAETAFAMGTAVLVTATPPNTVVFTPHGDPFGPSPADYFGSFAIAGDPPRTTGGAARSEALNAARRAALFLDRDPTPFEQALVQISGFELRNQFTGPAIYFATSPEHTRGTIRGGLLDNQIRIDYVQHAVAGMGDTLEWYGAK